jgi:hypothetical protein
MRRFGTLLLVMGFLLANAGTALFFLAVARSSNPEAPPPINDLILWFTWGGGAVLALIGMAAVLFARLRAEPAEVSIWDTLEDSGPVRWGFDSGVVARL